MYLNGHEYLKQQLALRGIGYEPLDNGLFSCTEPRKAQQICDHLDEKKIDTVFRKWLARLPHPFTAKDRAAGYRYDLSILQAEFSLTQVFDRPHTGRTFFEEIIRENLDLGRPSNVSLIFGRKVTKRTPGSFRTRVITEGVTPSLHIDYKRSKIKQYHKEGRALRTASHRNHDQQHVRFRHRHKTHNRLLRLGFSLIAAGSQMENNHKLSKIFKELDTAVNEIHTKTKMAA